MSHSGIAHLTTGLRLRAPFRAVFTGSMLLRKGLWYLLEAWKKLSPDDSELMLVGNIYPDGQRLMKNLPPGVKWCGPAQPFGSAGDLQAD